MLQDDKKKYEPKDKIDVRDVEFFCWKRDPEWTMTPDALEWLMQFKEKGLNEMLVASAKVAIANNRIRVWYEQMHTSVVYQPEDRECIQQKFPDSKPRFDSIFASVYVCRVCTTKLWSGLTSNRLMPPEAQEVLRQHAVTHIDPSWYNSNPRLKAE
jgi:hypothetical protein